MDPSLLGPLQAFFQVFRLMWRTCLSIRVVYKALSMFAPVVTKYEFSRNSCKVRNAFLYRNELKRRTDFHWKMKYTVFVKHSILLYESYTENKHVSNYASYVEDKM